MQSAFTDRIFNRGMDRIDCEPVRHLPRQESGHHVWIEGLEGRSTAYPDRNPDIMSGLKSSNADLPPIPTEIQCRGKRTMRTGELAGTRHSPAPGPMNCPTHPPSTTGTTPMLAPIHADGGIPRGGGSDH